MEGEVSISCKSERSQLNHEELRAVRISHHPDIYGLDSKELHVLKVRFREQRDKARGLARHKQREMRGKRVVGNDLEESPLAFS